MWEVVKRTNGDEKVVKSSVSYSEAQQKYDELAAKFNVQDNDGNYEHPEVRISLREVSVPVAV